MTPVLETDAAVVCVLEGVGNLLMAVTSLK